MKHKIIFLLIIFILMGCSQNSNEYNNEFIYYHHDNHFRNDTAYIDETIISEIKHDSNIVSITPYYYFDTEYCKDSYSAETERKIEVYVDGELVKSVDGADDGISMYIDGYYNKKMVEACVIKNFEYDENMISGFLSKRAATKLGVSSGENIIIEVNCAIPISNTKNVVNQKNMNDCVYVIMSDRLYKKVTLKIAVEGIISTDVDDIPAILISEDVIKNLVEQYQIEEVYSNIYMVETPLNKTDLMDLLNGIDTKAKINKRHWFSENRYYD